MKLNETHRKMNIITIKKEKCMDMLVFTIIKCLL